MHCVEMKKNVSLKVYTEAKLKTTLCFKETHILFSLPSSRQYLVGKTLLVHFFHVDSPIASENYRGHWGLGIDSQAIREKPTLLHLLVWKVLAPRNIYPICSPASQIY